MSERCTGPPTHYACRVWGTSVACGFIPLVFLLRAAIAGLRRFDQLLERIEALAAREQHVEAGREEALGGRQVATFHRVEVRPYGLLRTQEIPSAPFRVLARSWS